MLKKFISGVALALGPVAGVAAGDLLHWGSAGGWDVMIDPSLENGCLIQAEYQDGSLVRIGLDPSEGAGYVAAFNQAWGDIVEGETYPVLFDLDGEEYDGEATGIYVAGTPGADIYFDNPDFLFDIARKHTMTLFNESGEVMAIDLEGTYVGLEAVLQCQAEMN